jgi:ABC-type Fe3+ transport system permease subunit
MIVMMVMVTATVISIYLTKLQRRRYVKNNEIRYQLGILERALMMKMKTVILIIVVVILVVVVVVVPVPVAARSKA